MHKVRFYGWDEGFNKVAMTKLLAEDGKLGLLEAKKVTDGILENQQVILEFDEALAKSIESHATKIGAKCELLN